MMGHARQNTKSTYGREGLTSHFTRTRENLTAACVCNHAMHGRLVQDTQLLLHNCCVPMLLLLAITRYTNNCITVHRLHSDYEALPLRVNKHIVPFHSTVFIIIDISTLDTTSGDEVPTNTSCRSPAYEMSLPQFPAFSLSQMAEPLQPFDGGNGDR